MDYLLHIVIIAAIYTLLAVSLDLLVGHSGLICITHAAFFGIGAYASAVLSTVYQAPVAVGLLAGMCIACAVSLAISLPSLRLHEDYFVLATLAFQIITFSIFNNLTSVTGGPLGIYGIPKPSILGWQIDTHREFALVSIVFAGLLYALVQRLADSPFGRVLHAIREDEVYTKSLGKNTVRFKVTAFAVSAMLAAVSGSIYAHYVSYVDPTSFTVTESILVISMVIVGGAGSPWGPLVGAVVLVALPEVLRFVGLSTSVAADLRQILYGSMLVVMAIARPRGLAGRFGIGR